MSVVLLGTNRIEDCENVLSIGGQPLLKVLFSPLRIELTVPETASLPSDRSVRITEHEASPPQRAQIVSSPKSFAIFWDGDHALASATLIAENTAHLALDLRPLGINIYNDVHGLHIGGNTFAGNVVRRSATAISLG